MTRGTDWYGFHARIDLIDTPDALQAALADPTQRWYAQRRLRGLAASGALLAVAWNPLLHPRGRDGKWIERFGWVRWLGSDHKWRTGWVKDIDPTSGELTVRAGDGEHSFPNAKNLYSKPKPKASLTLPNVLTKEIPDKWKQIGGQGGSNPGAMFEIDGSFANESVELSGRSGLFNTLRALTQPGHKPRTTQSFDTVSEPAASFVPTDVSLMLVPRVDGTKGRYDMLLRAMGSWYRVPQSGSMTVDDLFRDELKVDPADAFGEPGSERRYRVLTDLGAHGTLTADEFDGEDVAKMVQALASPLPKVGDKYYVKTMNLPERARNEALANDFYELLGIPVPEVAVGDNGVTISSKVVGDTVPFDPNNMAHVAAVRKGFVGDAWLANWDVIGLEFDNVQIDQDGNAWRIDAGGALAWRAMGKPKGTMFGESVGELSSLRDPSINYNSSKVYGGITQLQLEEQARLLQTITPSQIQALADYHELPELGPVLIARRKSVLDQVGIVDPPPVDIPAPEPAPKIVFNPVEHAQQMGKPPTAAVDSWKKFIKLQTTSTLADYGNELSEGDIKDLVFPRNDDLWVYHSGYEPVPGGHKFLARNLYNGQQRRITLFNGSDQPYLVDYQPGSEILNDLVDSSTPLRDLAIAEFVARFNNAPLGLVPIGVSSNDPLNLGYSQVGIPSWNTLHEAIGQGRLGPDGDRYPLRHADGTLWEITKFPNSDTDSMILTRKTAGGDDPEIASHIVEGFPDTFKQTGPWYLPSNDATAAVWQSKFDPPPDLEVNSPDTALALHAKDQDVDDIIALLEPVDTPQLDTPGDDGVADAAGVKVADPELEALLAEEQAIADKMEWALAAAQPTTSVKIVHHVVHGLSPGEPILSTEMDPADANLQALVGKSVVVLPIASHDNPDWEGTNLGSANGLGTVLSVETKQQYSYATKSNVDITAMKVQWPSGGFSWVVGGDNSNYPKVVIPVETAAAPQQIVFKQNGDLYVNGVKVGTHWKPYSNEAYDTPGVLSYHYGGVIDADHSLTGKPLYFNSGKQSGAKKAANNLVVPIAAKPTKPKSTKVLATEEEVKKLNDELLAVESAITLTEADLTKALEAGTAIPTGKPLADGTFPVKGDWVFSTKDGIWAQIKQVELKFGPEHKQDPGNFLRVSIPVPQPDGTTKWKSTLRSRNTLVSGAGPGSPTPFVLQTKALTTSTGYWYGPGTQVTVNLDTVTVLDTTVDGNVKILKPDGTQKWVADIHVFPGSAAAPSVKAPPGVLDQAKVDSLNAQLAALNDDHAKLAATIATTVVGKPKKKKPVGTPYPGPAGATYKQPAWLAESREAKGLKNLKDGYVPTPGMILRHNDGTQYVVVEMGSEWDSHKNSVRVIPVGEAPSIYNAKWRAMSTMVVDHEAMLTDKNGAALPIVSEVEGADWAPESGMILSKQYTASYWNTNPATGKSEYRTKDMVRYFIVAYDGTVYNPDGTQASSGALLANYGSPDPVVRIGYLDKSHVGGKKLTVSIQPHHNAQIGNVQYAVIHDPGEAAAIPLAKQATPPPPPTPGPVPVAPPTSAAPPTPSPTPAAPNIPQPVAPTPTDELPVFTGSNPSGTEVPHPPTTTSSDAVPVFQVQGGVPTLDNAGLAGAHSVTAAITQTLDVAKQNKKDGTRKWVGTYGLGDHDTIEDMMVRTQTVRDAQGVEYVEVSFRLDISAARTAHTTFITSSVNEAGDWEMSNRNATNLVPGDLMAVRVASGGGVAPKGALRPDENGTVPNATVTAAPVLIGKNKDGIYDVYRTQVMTANGDIGYLDVEDRSGEDTLQVAFWDPTKPRTSNGAKSLNPNAQAAGWTTKTHKLSWAKSTEWQTSDIGADGVKKVGTNTTTAAPFRGTTDESQEFGAGMVIQRDYDGVHIEYATSPKKNSLDGHTVIRVKADDPDIQRKISEAMELVGVSKEAQKPPDKAALIKMATNKVYEQFSPVYTHGKTPNSPQEALDAIDKAVGEFMPGKRKATLDDISVRLSKDGRVQVLVSEDVSRAIVKKNGVKQYVHSFMASGKLNMVEAVMAGESSSILATTERFQHGLWYTGMSSGSDHGHDSADHMFLHMDKSGTKATTGSSTIDAVTLHRHVDYYFQPGDRYGERESNQLNWLNGPSGGELMLQRRFEADLITYIYLSSSDRSALIKQLHGRGIFTAPNGKPLEEFLIDTKPSTPPIVDFGEEIPLTSIPDDASTLTAVP